MKPEAEAETVEDEAGRVVVLDSKYGTRPVVGRVLNKYGTNPAVVGVVVGSKVGLDTDDDPDTDGVGTDDDPDTDGVDADDDVALHLQNLLGGLVGAGWSGASVGLLGEI